MFSLHQIQALVQKKMMAMCNMNYVNLLHKICLITGAGGIEELLFYSIIIDIFLFFYLQSYILLT